MTNLAPLMSSADATWRTPANVLDLVRKVGPIALDPCGHQDSIVSADVEFRLALGDNGLTADWLAASRGGLVYVNPPYGREIAPWVLRCHALGAVGGECIALLPARVDTSWWHLYCSAPARSTAACFWRGRLTFLGAPAPAPFPSAVVYWGPRPQRFQDAFDGAGWLVPEPPKRPAQRSLPLTHHKVA